MNVYGKLDQKHMTSWLDLLWNKTAYGCTLPERLGLH